MLDEELIRQMKLELPEGTETIFISSVSRMGIPDLKDLIWSEINNDSNKIVEINHRPMHIAPLENFYDDYDDAEEIIEEEEDEDEDISKYKGIGWDEL